VPIDLVLLTSLDARGYEVREALSREGRASPTTHSKAHTFICVDGKTYWVKGTAQQGLVAELICGRLAARVGAGPLARVIRVTPEALPAGGAADHLLGVVVGSEDEQNVMNGRDLDQLTPEDFQAKFDANLVDPKARALVVAFQSWVGVGDVQILVNLKTGKIRSIDHGECFNVTDPAATPTLIVLPIKGVPQDLGSDSESVDAAATQIEAVTDQQILDAVSGIPLGEPWKSPAARRLAIATWLAARRPLVREVMKAWK
jgi:hypothetical protein